MQQGVAYSSIATCEDIMPTWIARVSTIYPLSDAHPRVAKPLDLLVLVNVPYMVMMMMIMMKMMMRRDRHNANDDQVQIAADDRRAC